MNKGPMISADWIHRFLHRALCGPCVSQGDTVEAQEEVRVSAEDTEPTSADGLHAKVAQERPLQLDSEEKASSIRKEFDFVQVSSIRSSAESLVTHEQSEMTPLSTYSVQSDTEVVKTTVEEVYDYYNPSLMEVSERDVYDAVLSTNRRRVSVGKSTYFARQNSPSSEDELSQTLSLEEQGNDGFSKVVVTHWGVLVAKALWCRTSAQGQENQRSKLGLVAMTHQSSIGNVGKQRAKSAAARAVLLATRRAKLVVNQLGELVKRVGSETTDIFDHKWKEDALSFLFSADSVDTLMILAKGVGKLLAEQPTLVEAELPCKVFGDIHGQLRDLLLLFHAFGMPGKDPKQHFVFNGDFVDRGEHQLEVIGVLFALKMAMPKNVWLVRGNHEEKQMNRRYGFSDHCEERVGEELGQKMFSLMQNAFDLLPLACRIDGRLLVVHGGIGDGRWTLEDVLNVKRPLSSDAIYASENKWIFNILWSDPIEEDDVTRNSSAVFGVHGSPRASTALQFGWNVTKTFCALNGLDLVIRSHQCKMEGHGFDVMHEDMLIRVFSARDYEDYGNDCSIMNIASSVPGGAPTIRAQVLSSLTKNKRQRRRSSKKTEPLKIEAAGGAS